MTVDNFNWFLHSMLFIHTQRVVKQQKEKERRRAEEIDDDDDMFLNESQTYISHY
jgi:hypothetical protein